MAKTIKILSVLILLYTASVAAQVKIAIPKRSFQVQERIQAKLENQSSKPITFCVQFGQWSSTPGTLESTPTPFLAESNRHGTWRPLLNAFDIGSNRQPVEVESGKSMEFPFRLTERGTLRLRLDYWIRAKDLKCKGVEKGARQLHSATFTIRG